MFIPPYILCQLLLCPLSCGGFKFYQSFTTTSGKMQCSTPDLLSLIFLNSMWFVTNGSYDSNAKLMAPWLDTKLVLLQMDFINVSICSITLYGLKQALCAWYQALRSFSLDFGFTNSKFDSYLLVIN
ncbi:hypothetical protein CR513_50403, partial [Mucuna pruriens]